MQYKPNETQTTLPIPGMQYIHNNEEPPGCMFNLNSSAAPGWLHGRAVFIDFLERSSKQSFVVEMTKNLVCI